MNHIILFDSEVRTSLLPLTFTRPVSELRVGIMTASERWRHFYPDASISHITEDYLNAIYPLHIKDENLLINGSVLADTSIKQLFDGLASNEAIMIDGELIGARLPRDQFDRLINNEEMDDLVGYELKKDEVQLIRHLWEIPSIAPGQIRRDADLIDFESKSFIREDHFGQHPLYRHPSARLEDVFFNTDDGPIIIDRDAHLMHGSAIRGPVYIGTSTVIKMHANIYGGSSIGPKCTIAGELKNTTFQGFSNKGHEGYVGDSVIGSWCNLGALTTNSNLRNTFTNVKVYSYSTRNVVRTNARKCGFFMGDYARTAIHTSIGAGTVIGVSAHLFGLGFPKQHVPSFAWGGIKDIDTYDLNKALDAASALWSFKGMILDTEHREMLKKVFEISADHRMNL